MQPYAKFFREIKTKYDHLPHRDHQLICAQGFHMNCDVLKLRKSTWTTDDPTNIKSPNGGIFFSVWITAKGAKLARADYNIHSYSHKQLVNHRIASKDFCREFRERFNPLHASWPNVSTDFGCVTLMQGWFTIEPKTFPEDVLAMMKRFDPVAGLIDDLLAKRVKVRKRLPPK